MNTRNYTLTVSGKTNQTWNVTLKYVTAIDNWRRGAGLKSRSAVGIWLYQQHRAGNLVLDEKRLRSGKRHDGKQRNNFSIYSTPDFFDEVYEYCESIGTSPSRLFNELVRTFAKNNCQLNGKQNTAPAALVSGEHTSMTSTPRQDILELARAILAQNNAILAALLR
jgi:hypothetical protein